MRYHLKYKGYPASAWTYDTIERAIENDGRHIPSSALTNDVLICTLDDNNREICSENLLDFQKKRLTTTNESGKINSVQGETTMCLQNPLTQDVKNAVDALVAQGKSFTAFDVTKAVQAATGQSYIPHRYVRPEVVNLMQSGAYPNYDVKIRTDIPGEPREWYNTQPVASLQGGPYSVAGKPSLTPPVVTAPTPSIGVAKNEDGTRIRVFRDALEAVGLKAGAKVKVLYSPQLNSLFVVPAASAMVTNDPKGKYADYQVDVRQNVRVQLSTLGIPVNSAVTGVTKVNSETLQISLR